MTIVRSLRRIGFSLVLFAFALVSVLRAPLAFSAEETYQIVVHVPGVAGVVPADAQVTLIDAANASNVSVSRLIGQDSYGWFGVVDVPAGAATLKVRATKLTNSSVAINPAATRELWLNSKGTPYLYESAATLKLKVYLKTKGSLLSNRSLKVTIGKRVKTYKFLSSGSKRYLSVPVSSSTTSVKFTVLKSGKSGKTYTVNPRNSAKVWVGDYFSGVRTSESWANDKVTIHYHRANGDYTDWGVHAWEGSEGGTTATVTWANPILPVSQTPNAWGVKFEIPLTAAAKSVPIIIHKGNLKDPSTLNQLVTLAATDGEVWFEAGSVNADNTLRYTIPVPMDSVPIPVDPIAVTAPTSAQAAALASSSIRSAMAADNIYFVLTDRYQNGSTANDRMGLSGSREVTAFDPTSTAYYHGGDFAGLTDGCTTGNGIKRLKDMGFTSVWITPPFKQRYVQTGSAAYHGYWITDFTDIDPHLGTKAEFTNFISCVHSQGMKVVLDIVMNHTGDVNYYPSNNYSFGAVRTAQVASGDTNLRKPAFLNDLSNYHNRGDVQNWNNKEQSQNGDFFGLDDIATEKDVVIEGFAQVYANWVNDYGIDGFRIDTAKHLDDAFLGKWWPRVQQLTAASNPDLFAFGEVYDASTANLTGFVRDRGIPATLDFAFQNAAVQFASGNNISDITNVFGADDWYITGKSNAYNQPTFLGNHDMGRFGQMLKWAGSPAGDLWGDALLGYDLMYLSRGIPNVYYGDEVGIIGTGGDQASRQDLFPTGVVAWRSEARIAADPIGTGTYLTGRDHPIQERISWLNSVRNEHPALKTGAQIQRYSANNVVAFSRIDSSTRKEYLVAINNSQVTKSGLRIKTSSPNTVFTQVWGQTQSVTSDSEGFVTIWVGDRQAVVLQAQTTLPAANTVGAVSLSVTKDSGVALWKPRATITNWDDPSTCTFVVQVNGGAWQVLGVDDSADWKMILSGDKFTSGAKINIAAIVKSTTGAIGISNAIQITNTP
jgi:glycosidase